MVIFDGEKKEFCIRQQALLEASAGTGKTYAIQTLYLRLLLEEHLTPDKILVVTFTRLSAAELKLRLRNAIKELLAKVIKEEILPEYLQARERNELLRWLKGSLALMEKAKIFTIHGFCSYLLQRFRFDPISEDSLTTQDKVELLVKDALRLLPQDRIVALWQKEILMRHYSSMDILISELANLSLKKKAIDSLPIYPEQKKIVVGIIEKIKREHLVEEANLFEDLLALSINYKGIHEKVGIKATFLQELKRFCSLFSSNDHSLHFEELFLLEEENAKKKQVPVPLHYLGLLPILQKELFPFLMRQSDPLEIFATLGTWIQNQVRESMEKQALCFYEDLLWQARQLIQDPLVKEKVQEEFQAALIDEFQDTDALQWEIFSSLFTDSIQTPFYVVGDPKQSIYRFRQADLYTYFSVKNQFSNCYSLETNFRTAPRLLDALNELFSKVPNFLELPQIGKCYPCPAVRSIAREKDESQLVFWKVESEEQIFLLLQRELKKLQENGEQLFHSAILVKDHYQLKRLEKALDPNLCLYSENREPLEKTKSYFLLELLIDALLHPVDREKLQKLFLSPFFKDFGMEKAHLFSIMAEQFQNKGLLSAFKLYLESGFVIPIDEGDLIGMQHLIAEVEKKSGSSTQGLKILQSLKEQQPFNTIVKPAKDGIRVMTIHMSKGLEFDYLFPIALIAPFSQKKDLFFDSVTHRLCIAEHKLAQEEKNAEKMRLFYVAMTRAKQKIFLPFLPSAPKTEEKKSILQSFMDRRFLNESLEDFVQKTPNVELHDFVGKIVEPTQFFSSSKYAFCSRPFAFSLFSRQLNSFSSQVVHEPWKAKKTEPLFPAGKKVGTILHALLEKKSFALTSSQWQKILEKEIDPFLHDHIDSIANLLHHATHHPLKSAFASFSLAQLEEAQLLKEATFCMIDDKLSLQGVIDLTFLYEGRYYLLDYKSNHLDSYTQEAMEKEIIDCSYFEQGAVYQNALQKVLSRIDDRPFEELYGGFFYLFLRGPSSVYVRKF